VNAATRTRQGQADEVLWAALDAVERAEAHHAAATGLFREACGLLRQFAEARGGPPVDLTEQASLTRRQEQVLKLVCGGNSNRDIAAALNITERTVKQHLHSVFTKLGVRDRTEAAAVTLVADAVRIPEQARSRS
jgi:DNA-binding NarL/FixJ family response regulator